MRQNELICMTLLFQVIVISSRLISDTDDDNDEGVGDGDGDAERFRCRLCMFKLEWTAHINIFFFLLWLYLLF